MFAGACKPAETLIWVNTMWCFSIITLLVGCCTGIQDGRVQIAVGTGFDRTSTVAHLSPAARARILTATDLHAAQRMAQAVLSRSNVSSVTVHVGPGVYPPLTLSSLDSGTPTGWTQYQGSPGAVISGGMVLPASSPVPPTDPIYQRIPAGLRAQAQRIDVSAAIKAAALSPTGSSVVSGKTTLSCDGTGALDLAGWPANGTWALTKTPVGSNGFTYPADAPLTNASSNTLWLAGFFTYDWFDSRIPVIFLNTSNNTLFADTTHATYVVKNGHFISGARFRFLNQPEFLLRQGQYWVDVERGLAYVVASEQLGSCTLAVASTALAIENAKYVSLSGFNMESAKGSVVKVTNCSDIVIDNCTVQYGLTGVDVVGGSRVTVVGVHASAMGSTAISISAGDRPLLVPGNHMVTNCTIHDYGRVQICYRPGIKLDGVGNSATHNEIYNAPHQGMLIGGNDQFVAFNVIHDVLRESFDSGAIYKSSRDWTARGAVFDSNFFYNLGSVSDRCNAHTSCCRHAIYMDATEHEFTATRNLFIQSAALQSSVCNHGVFDNGGRNNRVSQNFCVGYPQCIRLNDFNLHFDPAFSEGMVKNFEPFHYRSPPYSVRYPSLAHLDPNISLPLMGNCSSLETCGAAPWHDEFSNNVMVNGTYILPADLGPFSPRFNVTDNINITMEEAGFKDVNPSQDNCWGLRSDSPIYQKLPGFQMIQLDQVGPPAFREAYLKRCGA